MKRKITIEAVFLLSLIFDRSKYPRNLHMRREIDMGRKPEWRRYFWVEGGIVSAALTVLDIASYLFFKIQDLYGLAQGILLMCCGILGVYALGQMMADGIVQMMGDALPFKTVYKESRIAYMVSGASYGTVLGTVLGALIYWAFNIPQPATTSELWFTAFLLFGLSAIVGAFAGYWIGKRRGFRMRITKRRETQ